MTNCIPFYQLAFAHRTQYVEPLNAGVMEEGVQQKNDLGILSPGENRCLLGPKACQKKNSNLIAGHDVRELSRT